jgi:hypothetical protein
MPFHRPWRTYEPGDLIYGLRANREELANHLGADGVYTIEQYDNFRVDRGNGFLFDPDFIQALDKHPKYSSVLDYDLIDTAVNSNWANEPVRAAAAAKRKAKAGLDWITNNTDRHIHFSLDGIDMVSVPAKSFAGVPPAGLARDFPQGKAPDGLAWDKKERSITGSELRWVYRHKDNPRVSAQIQFWNKTGITPSEDIQVAEDIWRPCSPPWSDPSQSAQVHTAWARYVPTNPYAP